MRGQGGEQPAEGLEHSSIIIVRKTVAEWRHRKMSLATEMSTLKQRRDMQAKSLKQLITEATQEASKEVNSQDDYLELQEKLQELECKLAVSYKKWEEENEALHNKFEEDTSPGDVQTDVDSVVVPLVKEYNDILGSMNKTKTIVTGIKDAKV
jgi:flagellar motility protein MotE (MotC chaperone)